MGKLVKIEVDNESEKNMNGQDIIFYKFTVTETFEVAVEKSSHKKCNKCKMNAPPPDWNDCDVKSFVYENHDGGRLLFPSAQDTEPERDKYPIRGWREIYGRLFCKSCGDKLIKFMEATND